MLPSRTVLPFSVCTFELDVDVLGRIRTKDIFARGHLRDKRCQKEFIYLLYCSLALLYIVSLASYSIKSLIYHYFIKCEISIMVLETTETASSKVLFGPHILTELHVCLR